MMSAAEQFFEEAEDPILGGSPVPPVVLPGQIDPHAVHYFYSAGERSLQVRARECGYSSIPPGFLVPLRPFQIREPNDTVDSLFDANAAKELKRVIEPRDSADGLMTRYQHRGGRVLFPLTGMEGPVGEKRAAALFSLVHPKMTCPRSPRVLARQCVHCRLADLRSEASLDRIERAKLSQKENIPYGLNDEGGLRFISDLEAATIIHQLVTSANEEIFTHMVEVLQVSDADVKAGRMGPGKKKFDKRDEWYLLNTHMTADNIVAGETVSEPRNDVGDIVSQTLRAVRDNAQAPVDVQVLLAAQEEKHQKELAAMEKRILASFAKAKKSE
jgi:hypothetical protein